MKTVDKIVFAVFVIALVVLCFFQQCSLDIYFLIFGFAVAAMSLIAMIMQSKSKKDKTKETEA